MSQSSRANYPFAAAIKYAMHPPRKSRTVPEPAVSTAPVNAQVAWNRKYGNRDSHREKPTSFRTRRQRQAAVSTQSQPQNSTPAEAHVEVPTGYALVYFGTPVSEGGVQSSVPQQVAPVPCHYAVTGFAVPAEPADIELQVVGAEKSLR
jgi:hypothetical protein